MRLTVLNKDGTKHDLKFPYNYLIGIPILAVVSLIGIFIIGTLFIFVAPLILIIALIMAIQEIRHDK
jgi:phosphate starvation-inducible membrane PsiE